MVYNLQSTIKGLRSGEANFLITVLTDWVSVLMQGLAGWLFSVAPYTVSGYLGANKLDKVTTDHPAFDEAVKGVNDTIDKLMSINGKQSVDDFHRKLVSSWNYCVA